MLFRILKIKLIQVTRSKTNIESCSSSQIRKKIGLAVAKVKKPTNFYFGKPKSENYLLFFSFVLISTRKLTSVALTMPDLSKSFKI